MEILYIFIDKISMLKSDFLGKSGSEKPMASIDTGGGKAPSAENHRISVPTTGRSTNLPRYS